MRSLASETSSWSSVYTRKPKRRSSNSLLLTLRSLSASFLSQAKWRTVSLYQAPPPIIHDIHYYPSRQFDPSRYQRLSLPPPLLRASEEGVGSQRYMDSEWVVWAHCSLHSLQTKRTPFLFKRFPFYLPHSGMCCLIPSPCLYPFDRSSSNLICFITPFPLPLPYSFPFGAPLVRTSNLKSYFTHRPSCS